MISFNLQIKEFNFDAHSQSAIEAWRSGKKAYGTKWPVVYIIHNDETREAYIGQTLHAGIRANQHWENEDRRRLKVIHVFTDDTFNKSVVLDLESYLIKYISADGHFKLQNGNNGLEDSDYYNREEYRDEFQKVWNELKKLKLVQSSIAHIEKSNLFKYSPYKSLQPEQQKALEKILHIIVGYIKYDMEQTVVIEGGAGTGKTILAVFLIKLLNDLSKNKYENDQITEGNDISIIQQVINSSSPLKIGFVVPMQSLRQSLKTVFSTIQGLSEKMILSPLEVPAAAAEGLFDILVCDEAHRLRQRKSLNQYPSYDNNNKILGLPKDSTELEWIIKCSRLQVFFYDEHQSVKPSDIPAIQFKNIYQQRSLVRIPLKSQLRCLGGDDYIEYINEVLNRSDVRPHGPFENYDLRFYDNVDEMMDEINKLNAKVGLSYGVAGYAWKWISKGAPKDTPLRDINIGKGYLWNRTFTDWINSNPLPYEIGCIHTVQGYDLNYAGVIFGPEITYDRFGKRVDIIYENYKDNLGRAAGGDMEALRKYIINIYMTLLTRGIHGTFIYVCDPFLRKYLQKYFDFSLASNSSNHTENQYIHTAAPEPVVRAAEPLKTTEWDLKK